MSKRLHPIQKLAERLVGRWPDYSVDQIPFAEKEIARHVKPLLDALEESDAATEHQPYEDGHCRFCNILAAWRAKL